jgi:hypothetical protein
MGYAAYLYQATDYHLGKILVAFNQDVIYF